MGKREQETPYHGAVEKEKPPSKKSLNSKPTRNDSPKSAIPVEEAEQEDAKVKDGVG